jgi:hypothetical protein
VPGNVVHGDDEGVTVVHCTVSLPPTSAGLHGISATPLATLLASAAGCASALGGAAGPPRPRDTRGAWRVPLPLGILGAGARGGRPPCAPPAGAPLRPLLEEPAMQKPLDPFVPPTSLTEADLRGWIAALELFPRSARGVVGGLDAALLDTPFRDGGWTVRQIVHHMADSHTNALLRVRWALTEERPTIKAYDENRWAELADARAAPVELSLALLDGVHGRLVALLSRLAPADFARPFLHPETGPSTVGGLTALYAWHGPHHLAQIEALAHRHAL